MKQATVYTKHLNFETRQYKIFNLDLGDGISHIVLVLALVGYVLWLPLMFTIFGVPTGGVLVALFTIPPMFLAIWAGKENQKQSRRRNLAVFVIKLGFLFFSKPLKNLENSENVRFFLPLKQNEQQYVPVTKIVKLEQKIKF